MTAARRLVVAALAISLGGCFASIDVDRLDGGALPGTDGRVPRDAGFVDAGPDQRDSGSRDVFVPDVSCTAPMVPVPVGAEGFCIDPTEVTNDEYAAFITAKNGDTSGQPGNCGFNSSWVPAGTWPPDPTAGSHPVRNVDWCDAFGYCAWAGKRLCGKIGGGSLGVGAADDPDLSQWFAACTAGGSRTYPYGDSFTSGACNVSQGNTAPAGSHAGCAGGFGGLLDMSGNVAEWIDACESQGGPNGRCSLAGGGFRSGSSSSCRAIDTVKREDRADDRGIRCCSR